MATLAASVRSKVHQALRRTRPATVAVMTAESDEPSIIKPTGQRGRWERVVASIPANVERIEFRDAKDNVVQAMDFEVEAPGAPEKDAGAARDLKLLALLQASNDAACGRQMEAIGLVLKEYQGLAKLLAERLTSMERGYGDVLKALFEATSLGAKAEALLQAKEDKDADGEDDIVKQAAGMVMELLGKKGVDKNAGS
jgi:hypothetical protein